jgi:hypothetical protein
MLTVTRAVRFGSKNATSVLITRISATMTAMAVRHAVNRRPTSRRYLMESLLKVDAHAEACDDDRAKVTVEAGIHDSLQIGGNKYTADDAGMKRSRLGVHGSVTSIKDLTPDPENRRLHDPRNVEMITESLKRVGAARSIAIDEDDVVLAGNGVVAAAKAAGITKVRVIEAQGNEIIAELSLAPRDASLRLEERGCPTTSSMTDPGHRSTIRAFDCRVDAAAASDGGPR